MKKLSKTLAIGLTMAMIFTVIPMNGKVQAATKKSTVTYELKNGTLTISGKGKMPKSMTFQNNKKIKKVVIKKGVTNISKYAFSGCKNLKTVKIPKTVKEIGSHSFEKTGITEIKIPRSVRTFGNQMLYKCDSLKKITMPGQFEVTPIESDEEWQGIMSGKKIDSITFNTNLSLKSVGYCFTNNLYVSNKDPQYKSIDGVIYTKDGKSIVRVPSKRKSLIIEEGCTEFCLQSITYGYELYDYGTVALCDKLKKVAIPQSVERIDNTKYFAEASAASEMILDTVVINSKKLSTESLMTLLNEFDNISIDSIMKQLPEQIEKRGNFYISNDKVLMRYSGKEKQLTIPSDIRKIAPMALKYKNYFYTGEESVLEKVIIPEGVTEIGDEAFALNDHLKEVNLPESLTNVGSNIFQHCDIDKIIVPYNVKNWAKFAFADSNAKEVVIPDNMKVIPEGMFEGNRIESVTIPDSVEIIGKHAFHCYTLKSISFGKNVKEIKEGAFAYAGFKNLVIPSTVTKIGKGAFAFIENAIITIEGDDTKIHQNAFYSCKGTTVIYKAGPTKSQTTLSIWVSGQAKKNKTKTRVIFDWIKISDISGYEIKISNDKNFKKNVVKMLAEKNETEKDVNVNIKPNLKKKIYVKIRPYKIVNGKKVYGVWSMDKL